MRVFDFIRGLFKKPTLENIDLSQSCKLIFVKYSYGEYVIQFHNPVYKRYWTLPEERCAIHARWSLLKRGSYGAYDSDMLSCSYTEIDYYKSKFKTVEDIKNYFDNMNKRYDRWQETMRKDNELPSIIR